jgi:1A family penicillin-binding protein
MRLPLGVHRIELPATVRRVAARVRWPLSAPQTLVAGVIALVAALLLYQNCGLRGCPDVRLLTVYQPGGASELLDRDGKRFADLAPYERVIVKLGELPEHVPNAFIAVEDRRFWDHHGVDWVRVFGAASANVRSRSVRQGSSTLSMQLARNIFPKQLSAQDRSMRRKLMEIRVARQIERRFEKRDILELYLNHIYFGGGAYGIDAAARLYFGKSASKLTLAEAATLAGLPKAPTHYDPRRHPERAKVRRDLVLSLMEGQQLITPAEAKQARGARLAARTTGRSRSGVPLGAYFIDVVRDMLEDRYGEALYRRRLRVQTTLDPVAQRAAEKELTRQLEQLDGRVRRGSSELQGAIVVLEAKTGDVLALVGGRDPAVSRYNRATRAQRQVGSAFKPFVYAAALSEGVPTSQLVLDAPLRMELSRNDVWEPVNYDGTYEGEVPLRDALVRSRNIPTIRLATAIGIDDVVRTARLAGIGAAMDPTPALALGTVAMSPLQLATAYTTFATLGTTAEPRFLLRVEDETGTVLWEQQSHTVAAGIDPGVAYIITDILRDAVDYGTGTGVRSAGFRGAVAGKTGTTSRATDAWFVGYTPDVVGAVWIGYDEPSSLGNAATGGGYAAPVWGRIMRTLFAERRASPAWQIPSNVKQRQIDPYTGYVLEDGCQPQYGTAASELFIDGNLPASSCPYRDWWGNVWDRIGGIFNGRGNERRDEDGGRRRDDGAADAGMRGVPRSRERTRQEEMDDFLRRRSDKLRDRRGNRGTGN